MEEKVGHGRESFKIRIASLFGISFQDATFGVCGEKETADAWNTK